VLDVNGDALDEVKEVLDIAAKNDMALASGHLHVGETWNVFEEAIKRASSVSSSPIPRKPSARVSMM
jgi:hypothetical protein